MGAGAGPQETDSLTPAGMVTSKKPRSENCRIDSLQPARCHEYRPGVNLYANLADARWHRVRIWNPTALLAAGSRGVRVPYGADYHSRLSGFVCTDASLAPSGRAPPGPKGAIAIDTDGNVVTAEAPPVEVVDTIGAGDVFNAGFLAACAAGESLKQSLAAGTSVASLAISTHPRRYDLKDIPA